MGAGTPLSTTTGTTKTKRWWILAAGTVTILAVGGVATQFWRSQLGSAAEPGAGSAKVNAAKKQAASSTGSSTIVAKVGKESVTEDMLARECIARHGKDVLEDLINRLIIQQACEAQGKQVSQKEVEDEINKIAKRFNLDPKEWEKMLQSERNITPSQYRMSVIWPMLALKKLAETSALDDIDEETLQKEFERQYGERVRCRMIMLDNLRRAQSVWNECKKNPGDFDKLAQDHSIDPNSKSLGGAIPPIPRHSGNDTVEKVAFKLQPGEISGVVEIRIQETTRYAIFKCEGKTEPVVKDLEDVREQLVNELVERRTQENVAKVFEQIKSQTPVTNHLTGTSNRSEPGNPASKAATKNGGIKQTSAEQPAGAARVRTATSKTPTRD